MFASQRGLLPRLLDLAALLALALTLAAVLSSTRQQLSFVTPDEKYDARLLTIDTVDELVATARRLTPSGDPHAQAAAVENILRYRFYHGYSRYDFHDNWVLWLAARLVHPDLDAIVAPEDILKHPWAACSQQGIVTQQALKRFGMPTATVEWPAHFTAAAFIDNDWYVVDPWGPLDRDRSQLWRYADWVDKVSREKILGPKAAYFDSAVTREPPRLTKIDQFPAPTMAWFHPLTKAMSSWLWVLALAWLATSAALSVHRHRAACHDGEGSPIRSAKTGHTASRWKSMARRFAASAS